MRFCACSESMTFSTFMAFFAARGVLLQIPVQGNLEIGVVMIHGFRRSG